MYFVVYENRGKFGTRTECADQFEALTSHPWVTHVLFNVVRDRGGWEFKPEVSSYFGTSK